MINPQSINLSLLPSVPLARRKKLPELPAIYFVMVNLYAITRKGIAAGIANPHMADATQ